MAGLSQEEEIRMELRAACSSDVNKLLFEFVDPAILDTATEDQLLSYIRKIAVKGLHKEVHRVNLVKLSKEMERVLPILWPGCIMQLFCYLLM